MDKHLYPTTVVGISMTTVLNTTVKNGFCCGCGVCAGLCPKNAIRMEFNVYGEYNPILIDDCSDCGLCLKVCPFADGNPNEDELGFSYYASIPSIQHRKEIGYYHSVGVGAVSSLSHRLHSVSGGLATWFLQKLLLDNIVDAVICVHHYPDPEKLFCFTVAKTLDDIYSSAGSVYYPVEISDILVYIRENPGRYAIIGLPCLLKGLRLAQEKNPILRERIIFLIGLACANQKSAFFTKYAAWSAGVKGNLVNVDFRGKDLNRRLAKFFTFTFLDDSGKTYSQPWGDELSSMYQNKCFTLHSCDCCDDTFAECADICFMDAWLPEYIFEPRGMSAWISRSSDAERLMQEGISNSEIETHAVSLDALISGQAATRWKGDIRSYRLQLLSEAGEIVPEKRRNVGDVRVLSLLERERCRMALLLQREGRVVAAECGNDFETVHKWFMSVSKAEKFGLKVLKFVDRKIQLLRIGVRFLVSRV